MFHKEVFSIAIYKKFKSNHHLLVLATFSELAVVFWSANYIYQVYKSYIIFWGYQKFWINIYIWLFLVNSDGVLLVALVKYTISQLRSHCTWNCIFWYSLETVETLILWWMVEIFLCLCIYFVQKTIELVLEELSWLGYSWWWKTVRSLIWSINVLLIVVQYILSFQWADWPDVRISKYIVCYNDDWLVAILIESEYVALLWKCFYYRNKIDIVVTNLNPF